MIKPEPVSVRRDCRKRWEGLTSITVMPLLEELLVLLVSSQPHYFDTLNSGMRTDD